MLTVVGEILTEIGRGPDVIVSVRFALCVSAGLPESVTFKVSGVLVTAAVGVPVIAPVDPKDNPAGSVPLVSDQVYGAVPPVAARVALYGVPTWPLGSVDVRTEMGPGRGGRVAPPPPLAQPCRRRANAGTNAGVLRRRGKQTCEEFIASVFSLRARRGQELTLQDQNFLNDTRAIRLKNLPLARYHSE
jgi:hypothetical protein